MCWCLGAFEYTSLMASILGVHPLKMQIAETTVDVDLTHPSRYYNHIDHFQMIAWCPHSSKILQYALGSFEMIKFQIIAWCPHSSKILQYALGSFEMIKNDLLIRLWLYLPHADTLATLMCCRRDCRRATFFLLSPLPESVRHNTFRRCEAQSISNTLFTCSNTKVVSNYDICAEIKKMSLN